MRGQIIIITSIKGLKLKYSKIKGLRWNLPKPNAELHKMNENPFAIIKQQNYPKFY